MCVGKGNSKKAINNKYVHLTPEQIIMLEMSNADIKNGKIISQEELDKQDLNWLKTQK